MRTIISRYTREAGVRNLEREIGQALRHAAVRIADGEVQHVDIGPDDLGIDRQRRGVIDDDQVEIGMRLREHRFQGAQQDAGFTLIVRDYHAALHRHPFILGTRNCSRTAARESRPSGG